MTKEFKYLKVVTDGTEKYVGAAKQYYRVISEANGQTPAIIESLHGYTSNISAREFCIDRQVTNVIVRYFTPESKYTEYKDKEFNVDPSLLTLSY